MAKTKEELNKLKEKYEALNNKLSELTEDEFKQVTAGTDVNFVIDKNDDIKNFHIYENNVAPKDKFIK